MTRYPLVQVDAFTSVAFTGNPAGVVPEADGLTDAQMQAIAREVNASETAFILPPDAADHDVRVRYFTPTVEVPTCGHATVAAHFVRAVDNELPASRVLAKIGVGILPVDILRDGDADPRIVMTQSPPVIEPPLDSDTRAVVLDALHLAEAQIDPRCPIQCVSTGHGKVIVGVSTRAVLDGLVPDMAALDRLGRAGIGPGFFVFTLRDPDPDVLAHARMFAPAIGIPEDPVTGNGNGPLGAYLVHHGLTPAGTDGETCFRARQGEAMGRPGTADVWVRSENGRPIEVRVGGDATIVFRGEIEV